MAYSLRDIIKQRAGEIASSNINATIFKFKPNEKWRISMNIKDIGYNGAVQLSDVFNMSESEIAALTELPTGTYVKQVGTSVEKMSDISIDFNDLGTDTTLPKDLFTHAINLTEAPYCFRSIYSIVEIPNGFLKNCTKLKNVELMFYQCAKLKSIPENLFANCTDIENFRCVFSGCKSLEEIPEHLFDNNKSALNFNAAFYNCIKLKGNTPELWNRNYKTGYSDKITGSDCFAGCNGLSNYNNIPSDWK